MRQVSTTITVGIGSEKHNHDLDYRDTLTHVHGRENGVIEVIPYEKSYEEQIDALMKPYIDAYNEKVNERYSAAWLRYKSGAIKSKPKRRDFPLMSYDYYNDHKDDTYFDRKSGKNEPLPIFRSVILGLGDQTDRQDGRITEQEAVATLQEIIKEWPDLFPDFKLLGATIHLDESGFYHAHIDYKPVFEKSFDKGLQCSISQEAALEHMGYDPEQSIINGRDKVPIRFNAFRNHLYRTTEVALARHQIRLQYGVSQIKEPGKDSSQNEKLENWQATRDAARELQQAKNIALDVLSEDRVTPVEIKQAGEQIEKIQKIMTEAEESPRSRLDKSKMVVEFRIFDQLRSFLKDLIQTMALIIKQRNRAILDAQNLQRRLRDTEKERNAAVIERDGLLAQIHDSKDLRQKIAQAKELGDLREFRKAAEAAVPDINERIKKEKKVIGPGGAQGGQFGGGQGGDR